MERLASKQASIPVKPCEAGEPLNRELRRCRGKEFGLLHGDLRLSIMAPSSPRSEGSADVNRLLSKCSQLSQRYHVQNQRNAGELEALRAEIESVLEAIRVARQEVGHHICSERVSSDVAKGTEDAPNRDKDAVAPSHGPHAHPLTGSS